MFEKLKEILQDGAEALIDFSLEVIKVIGAILLILFTLCVAAVGIVCALYAMVSLLCLELWKVPLCIIGFAVCIVVFKRIIKGIQIDF